MNRSDREALVKGLNQLDQFVESLGLGENIRHRATEIYRQAMQADDILPGRGVETIVAGCVLLAGRESSEIIEAEDIVEFTSDYIQEKRIHRTTKALRNELDLGFVLVDPHKYVDPVGDDLDADDHDKEFVRIMIDILRDDGASCGNQASAIVGSLYYVTAILPAGNGEWVQHEIADAADISEVTIRNNYREFANVVLDEFDEGFGDDFDPIEYQSED